MFFRCLFKQDSNRRSSYDYPFSSTVIPHSSLEKIKQRLLRRKNNSRSDPIDWFIKTQTNSHKCMTIKLQLNTELIDIVSVGIRGDESRDKVETKSDTRRMKTGHWVEGSIGPSNKFTSGALPMMISHFSPHRIQWNKDSMRENYRTWSNTKLRFHVCTHLIHRGT